MPKPKPTFVFDVCHERVREYLTTQYGVGAVQGRTGGSSTKKNQTRVAIDYVLDFEIVGRRALRFHTKRLVEVFALYYCQDMPYREAIKAIRVKPGTFDWYCYVIRRKVGVELLASGLYPPSAYRKLKREDEETCNR